MSIKGALFKKDERASQVFLSDGYGRAVIEKPNGKREIRRVFSGQYKALTDMIKTGVVTTDHPCSLEQKFREEEDLFILEEEYASAGSLESLIDKIKRKKESFDIFDSKFNPEYAIFISHLHQLIKSITRQLIEYLSWLNEHYPYVKPCINPKTVFLRDDGSIAVRKPDIYPHEVVILNPWFFFENCCYTDPRISSHWRYTGMSIKCSGIWSVGAIAYSLFTGKNLMFGYRESPYCSWSYNEEKEKKRENFSEMQKKSYDLFRNFFLYDREYENFFGDFAIGNLVRECFKPDQTDLSGLMNIIYTCGTGFVMKDSVAHPYYVRVPRINWQTKEALRQLPDAWATPIRSLALNPEFARQTKREISFIGLLDLYSNNGGFREVHSLSGHFLSNFVSYSNFFLTEDTQRIKNEKEVDGDARIKKNAKLEMRDRLSQIAKGETAMEKEKYKKAVNERLVCSFIQGSHSLMYFNGKI